MVKFQNNLHDPLGRGVQFVVFKEFKSGYLFQNAREKSFDYLFNIHAIQFQLAAMFGIDVPSANQHAEILTCITSEKNKWIVAFLM